MSTKSVINVGVVGLEFGAEFIPIYQRHPNANMYAICQRTQEKLDAVGDQFGVEVRYNDYAEMLKDPNIDLIHINTPLQLHADQVVAALEAGKHVGCTIPMATSVEDCKRIVDAQRATGLVYMMMETVVYSREFLYIQEQYEAGNLGKLQFLRSSHHQDMTGWPSYWDGMPPMHNATHAVSPVLALGNNQAESVQCLGSGTVFERMKDAYGSPFAIESTHIKFKDSDIGAEVTRNLWTVARQYRESFDAYGAVRSFEWSHVEGEKHIMHTGEEPVRIDVPDYAHRLPEAIQAFTTGGVYSDEGDEKHRSFVQGGGHGGSHPHLVHTLLQAVLRDEQPYLNAVRSANITCSGILSHESAQRGGEKMMLPKWTLLNDNIPMVIELDENCEPPWAGLGEGEKLIAGAGHE
ncbi:oxidoreductase [Arthrobacter sp. MYb227]|uniref:Gfo/Idh/MocA family protein n=1 Tax=Arthrobacter sp. MYb227 TaxID=1848601 RepID=UPI000CFAC872|nr:Gfo/Idh/MocA family oxidoreductase [Arthrobacter sp. MYb227]PQZ94716.1 oxidoreductase [Arthrobacter sp. MYb227]